MLRFYNLVPLVLYGLAISLLASPGVAASYTPQVVDLTLGFSTAGRPITAVRVGTGARELVLVGATHGGPEANTYRLVRDLIAHFRAAPAEVPRDVRLLLIPTLNPDGLALDTRFNTQGVDLNRNMDTGLDACPENDWRTQVYGARGIVSATGGSAPETEVESRLIRAVLYDSSAAIFYHSAGGELFPPYCAHQPSIALAEAYADAAGYTYTRYYPRYMITGGMHDWAGSLDIAAFTPELWNGEDSDTRENHTALHALFAETTALLPLPAARVRGAFSVPAPIWRFWQSNGGLNWLGEPLEPARIVDGQLRQTFSGGTVVVDAAHADTAAFVTLDALRTSDIRAWQTRAIPYQLPDEANTRVRFAETARRWAHMIGEPIGTVEAGVSFTDGTPRTVQYFTRARLELNLAVQPPRVVISPLGWYTSVQAHARAAITHATLR